MEGELDVVEFREDGRVVRAAPGSVVVTSSGWRIPVGDDGLAFVPSEPGPEASEPESVAQRRADVARSLAACRVGAWQMMCCLEDLYRIEDEDAAQYIREQLQEELQTGDYAGAPQVFATELEGLRQCRRAAENAHYPPEPAGWRDRALAEIDARIAQAGDAEEGA